MIPSFARCCHCWQSVSLPQTLLAYAIATSVALKRLFNNQQSIRRTYSSSSGVDSVAHRSSASCATGATNYYCCYIILKLILLYDLKKSNNVATVAVFESPSAISKSMSYTSSYKSGDSWFETSTAGCPTEERNLATFWFQRVSRGFP